MATAPLTFNPGQTAILMADFHREGMGDNPMVRERGTVHKARAVLEAARQAGVLVVYIVVNFRPGYPEISDRNVIFRERKTSGRVPPTDPVSLGDFRKRPYYVRVGMRRCSSRNVNPDSIHEVLSCACSTPHGKADRRSLRRKSPISASRHPN